jgi:hypothetical protein
MIRKIIEPFNSIPSKHLRENTYHKKRIKDSL